jgi:3'-5' exoribonuclease
MAMPRQSELKELKKGDKVEHYLLIKRSELRSTKAGNDYLSLELGDKSVSLNANVWEKFEEIANAANVGEVVRVNGLIEEFQGTLQIKVLAIKKATPADNVTPIDFLPKSSRDLDEMINELEARIEKLNNVSLKDLIKRIITGDRLIKFSTAPAGKSWHHGYIHGLIEHTLEIIKICDLMCDFHPELNRDLLVCGAILHDIGKISELSYDSAFEYTDEGKLIGHIVIAAMLVKDEIKNIPEFPEELERNLIHLILSHQGKLEHASPVVPKTVEAIALYQADELSAKVNAYKNALSSELKGDSNWTKFITLAQTDLYKSNNTSGPEEKINKSLFD